MTKNIICFDWNVKIMIFFSSTKSIFLLLYPFNIHIVAVMPELFVQKETSILPQLSFLYSRKCHSLTYIFLYQFIKLIWTPLHKHKNSEVTEFIKFGLIFF